MAVVQGQFNGRSQYYLTMTVNQGAQSVSDNYTNVGVDVRINESPNWGSWSNTPLTWSWSCAGQGASGSTTYDFRNYDVLVLWSGSINVGHNADGTQTIYFSAAVGGGTTIGSANTGTGGLTLSTIPRASTPSFSGGSTFEPGTVQTINTNRASSGFTHSVYYAFGSVGLTLIASGVGASTTWTPPMSLLNEIPNSPSGNGMIRLITFNGGTQIGYKDIAFYLNTPASVVPTWTSVSVSENESSVASAVGAYVQGVSRLAYGIVGASGVYGSSIFLQRFSVAGQTVDGASGVTPLPINQAGTVPVSWLIQDSRGKQKTETQNITVLPYATPTISSATVVRALNDGTPDPDEGTYLRVSLNAIVQSLMNGTQRNIMQIKVRSRPFGSSTPWTDASTLKTTINPTGISYNSFIVVNGPFLVDQSYEVRIEVLDRFNTSGFQTSIAVGAVFMHWGDGLGLGKYYERGMLDVNGDIYQSAARVVDANDLWFRKALLPAGYRGSGTVSVRLMGTSTILSNVPWVAQYLPMGSRVVNVAKTDTGYVITGHSQEEGYGRWIRLDLQNNWKAYDEDYIPAGGWSDASVVRLPSGIVKMNGMIRGGTVTAGTVITTLPPLYRPDRNMIFLISNNDVQRSITINTDGTVVARGGWVAGNYISLDKITYPAAGVAEWTEIGSTGSGSAWGSGWSGYSTGTWGAPAYWKDAYGFVWFTGLVTGPGGADNTNIFTLPATHRADLEQHISTTSSELYGLVGARPTDGINFKTNTNTSWISLAGVTVRTADALSSNIWYYPGGGVRDMPLGNGWTYSGSFPLPSYTIREDGLCVSAGLIRSGTIGSMAFKLVAEATTLNNNLIMTAANLASARVDLRGVNVDPVVPGQVIPVMGSNSWVSLDGTKWVPGGM